MRAVPKRTTVLADLMHGQGKCREKNWNILYKIFKGHLAYEYLRPFKNQPGVGAYFKLRDHYLGPNNVNNVAADLEKQYSNLTYSQETGRWNFEDYVSKHVELHNVAQSLVPHGYGAADEGTRVRRLISGIKTHALDTIKGQILGSPELSRDFGKSVCLFKDFIVQTKTLSIAKHHGPASIASAPSSARKRKNDKTQTKSGRRQRGRIANVKVQDRYYTSKEYARLTSDQKIALKRMREERTGDEGAGNRHKKSVRVSQVSIEELTSSVSSLTAALSDNKNDTQSPKEANAITNRNNPVLSRRRD
jgi:hypothetical protein